MVTSSIRFVLVLGVVLVPVMVSVKPVLRLRFQQVIVILYPFPFKLFHLNNESIVACNHTLIF